MPASSAAGPPALDAADRILGRVETFLNLLASFAIFALMFIGVAQVLGRKLLDMPVTGYVDLVEQSIAVFAFLGIAYCQRHGGHIRMELLLGSLRGRLLWLAEVVGVVATLFIITVLIPPAYEHFLRAYELGDTTIDAELPVWPSKLVVPVAFAVLWLRLVVQLWGYGRLVVDPSRAPFAVPVVASVAELAAEEVRGTMSDEDRRRGEG